MDDAKSEARSVSERRQSVRVTQTSKIRLIVDAHEVTGDSENLSPTDVMFYTDQPLAVTVEIQEDGVVKRVAGHVVRMEPVQGERSGWAIEFDRARSVDPSSG